MLTGRQGELLRFLVGDYIDSASSVSSAGLVARHGLAISAATVRNELAEMEEAGYIARPHTSAGVVPTERGYREYVETLMARLELPAAQRWTIRHQFHQVEREEERWMRLAAAMLAQHASALAVVTPLRAAVSRLRAVELVPLEEMRALLVVVLQGGYLRRVTVHFLDPEPPEELERTAHRLTAGWAGRTRMEIARWAAASETVEGQVLHAVLDLMGQTEAEMEEAPYLYGFSQVLSQPEFLDGGLIRGILRALEDGRLVAALRPQNLAVGDLRVIIGQEHAEEFLRSYGAVMAVYGSEEGQGTVAVLGPTRMAYAAAIPSVRYMAQILTELVRETAPGDRRTG